MNVTDNFRFYFGAASGSERKALRRMEEPHVMINYATKNNQPWAEIGSLFVDSGGYSFMLSKGEYGPVADYAEYLAEVQPDRFALRDYPCEPEILDERGETVESHQRQSTDAHIETLATVDDYPIDGTPVTVVQGWTPSDYVAHVDQLRDHGLPLDHVAVGSTCRRHAEKEIKDVLKAVDAELPAHSTLHAFGVKTSVFQPYPELLDILDSADSLAYSSRANYDRESTERKSWRDLAYHYLEMRRSLLACPSDQEQTTLGEIPADG